jgi:hypothetical protein
LGAHCGEGNFRRLVISIAVNTLSLCYQVSSSSSVLRTARECEIRWLGDRHAEINHSPWEQDELLRLNAILGDYQDGGVDWVLVARKLGVRFALLTFLPSG